MTDTDADRAALRARRPCPPWCDTDHDEWPVCQSATVYIGESPITLFARATAALASRSQVVAVHGDDRNSSLPAQQMWIYNAMDADSFARILEVLAVATPEDHRALAAQVRAAAELVDFEDD